MKKLLSLLLVLLTASSVLAQEQPGNVVCEHPILITGGHLVIGHAVTDSDNGKTITLHVGEKLLVQLPNERHYVSGDEHYGLESVSTVSFDGLSTDGILTTGSLDLGDGSTLQDDRSFVAAAVGDTTLSYKRMTSYVGHGACGAPMCMMMETISFNIVVTE
ncbi:MAG: hypothetical protein K2W97_00430 [Chthoniobacterales bacterium]|nr:hypothetical protein [Chthoniobacterales bacterium]